MGKQKYTEEIHARRLYQMIEDEKKCDGCPAAPWFDGYTTPYVLWTKDSPVCQICLRFISLDALLIGSYSFCPCNILGEEVAIRRTKETLAAGGYIEKFKADSGVFLIKYFPEIGSFDFTRASILEGGNMHIKEMVEDAVEEYLIGRGQEGYSAKLEAQEIAKTIYDVLLNYLIQKETQRIKG